MQALKCFSVFSYENTQVSMTLMNGKSSPLVSSPMGGGCCIYQKPILVGIRFFCCFFSCLFLWTVEIADFKSWTHIETIA